MLVVFSAGSSQGALGTRREFPLAEGHSDLQLTDECTHTCAHKLLHVSEVANPNNAPKLHATA